MDCTTAGAQNGPALVNAILLFRVAFVSIAEGAW